MLFRFMRLRGGRQAHSHRYRVPTIHSARTQRLKRLEGGIIDPIERANNMLRREARKDSRRFNPNVNILEICRDKNYESFVRELLASEVRELTGEYVPGHEQTTLFDVNCTQVLPEATAQEDSNA